MENDKPRLSLDEQIQHLKDKGILFNIMDEESAKQYLKYNNNYYKLTSFRKNYDKHPGGENKGKYIRLEFSYLVDMSIIDMRLRYKFVAKNPHACMWDESHILLDKYLEK